MATVYFVRHGETLGNVQKLILHPDEDILSKGGILEATLLSHHLADIKFSKAYCSDYPRAVNTAEILLNGNTQSNDLELKKDKTLREICTDSLNGKFASEPLKYLLEFLETGRPMDEFSLPGTESLLQVKARASCFFKELCEYIDTSEEPETILVVSHGLYLKCVMDIIHEAELANDLNVVNWDEKAGCGRIMKNATYMKLSIGRKCQDSLRSVEFAAIHVHSHLNSIPGTDSLTRMVKTKEWAPLSGCFQV